jgi:8-oxo-dGTP diphosphatase
MTHPTDTVGKKTIRVVAAVVEHEGHYLITQRRESAVLPSLWEFPGGKVEENEEDEDALRRELRERLDAEAKIGKKLGEKVHEYDGYRVALVLYEAILVEGKPLHARRVKDFRWVASSDFDKYPFPDADQQTMDQLLGFTRG